MKLISLLVDDDFRDGQLDLPGVRFCYGQSIKDDELYHQGAWNLAGRVAGHAMWRGLIKQDSGEDPPQVTKDIKP